MAIGKDGWQLVFVDSYCLIEESTVYPDRA